MFYHKKIMSLVNSLSQALNQAPFDVLRVIEKAVTTHRKQTVFLLPLILITSPLAYHYSGNSF